MNAGKKRRRHEKAVEKRGGGSSGCENWSRFREERGSHSESLSGCPAHVEQSCGPGVCGAAHVAIAVCGMPPDRMAAVGGMIYIGSKSKFVPYVIEVNKLGEAVSLGPAQVAAPADPRVVRASLASFIVSARLVTPDVTLQREAIFRVYAMLHTKDAAAQQMNEWYNGKGTTPFDRAAKVTVTTDINSVLPISGNSWQV